MSQRFNSHKEAATWYREQELTLPSNCIVDGNPPLPLSKTHKNPGSAESQECGPIIEDEECGKVMDICGANQTAASDPLEAWDSGYQQRAKRYGVFLACTPQYLELHNPPVITDDTMYKVFKRIPGTRNPGSISIDELGRLKKECGI